MLIFSFFLVGGIYSEKEAYQPFLETRNAGVPLRSEFKPQLKLLSRKPVSTPPSQAAQDKGPQSLAALASGIQRVTLATPDDLGIPFTNDDDDDDDDEKNKEPELTPEERQRKAQAELAEKQRKYEEIRQQLFGTASGDAPATATYNNNNNTYSGRRSGTSTPGSMNGYNGGNNTANNAQRNRNNRRGGGNRAGSNPRDAMSMNGGREKKQLFDPTSSPRPSGGGSNSGNGRNRGGRQQHQSRERSDRAGLSQSQSNPQPAPSQNYIMPIRAPKGPDGSGRGGFGFAPRGGRSG